MACQVPKQALMEIVQTQALPQESDEFGYLVVDGSGEAHAVLAQSSAYAANTSISSLATLITGT